MGGRALYVPEASVRPAPIKLDFAGGGSPEFGDWLGTSRCALEPTAVDIWGFRHPTVPACLRLVGGAGHRLPTMNG
jgi:hypothetical protein